MSKAKLLRLKKQAAQIAEKPPESSIKPMMKQAFFAPNSIFTLFHKGDYKREWFVWRDSATCKKLTEIRGGQKPPRKTLEGASAEQIAFARANSLLQKLEMHGSQLNDFWDKKIVFDNKHGKVNRKDRLVTKPEYQAYRETAERYNQTLGRDKNEIIPCVSPGFYHTHFSDGKNSRVLMWMVFPDTKLIVIADLGHHENFNYKLAIDPIPMMFQAMKAALDQGFYTHQAIKKEKVSDPAFDIEEEPYSGPASSNGRIA